jgi:hypothetical protein
MRTPTEIQQDPDQTANGLRNMRLAVLGLGLH